jgi:hypothetical protein
MQNLVMIDSENSLIEGLIEGIGQRVVSGTSGVNPGGQPLKSSIKTQVAECDPRSDDRVLQQAS